jgi:hypothetical protein
MLLTKDKYGNTTWQRAARFERLKAFLENAKKAEVNPHELLVAQNERGETALHMTTERSQVAMYM